MGGWIYKKIPGQARRAAAIVGSDRSYPGNSDTTDALEQSFDPRCGHDAARRKLRYVTNSVPHLGPGAHVCYKALCRRQTGVLRRPTVAWVDPTGATPLIHAAGASALRSGTSSATASAAIAAARSRINRTEPNEKRLARPDRRASVSRAFDNAVTWATRRCLPPPGTGLPQPARRPR